MAGPTPTLPRSDWRCIRNLGQGSFGVVELWKNSKTGKMNAVKRFEIRKSGPQSNEKMVEEFKRLWRKEVELMTTIEHCPYIVSAEPVPEDVAEKFKGVGTNVVPPLLFMEYCSGGNLRNVLKLPENICGLGETEVVTILDNISQAITFLHNLGLVHRDLKPDNILRFVDANNRIIYKLSDMGFAKDVSKSQNQCSTFVGTPQYLAPEVYQGNSYDRTVDYWSFAVIAFEICTGIRPFLHGESPANWLPLVEEKAKDVVCIYRNSEGKIVFSNTIPFYTHLPDVLKECLTAWLRTMLQLDPARRGRKITAEQKTGAKDSSTSDLVNLKLLSATLSTKFLEIQAIKEKLTFPIGQTGQTKIGDIQQRIGVKTNLIPDNQLILTLDGLEVLKTETASKYIGMDLYLVPRCVDLVRMKMRFPTTVNNFILQWDTVKDPIKLRKVWACAIFYLQAELRKIETTKKIVQALKSWCTLNYTNKIKALQIDIEKAGSSLGTVLELESRFESIDEQYSDAKKSLDLTTNVGEFGKKGSRHWTEEMSKLHNHYRNCFDQWVENVVLKAVITTELEELYYKVLKACGDWKSSDTNSSPFSFTEILLRSVCQFILKGTEIDDALLFNIRTQFDKIRSDMSLMEEMKSVVTKLNQLTSDILRQRCSKQALMVQMLNGTDLPTVSAVDSVNENQKENSPPNSSVATTATTNNPTTYSVRGGGYRNDPPSLKRMCQSTLPTTSTSGPTVAQVKAGQKMTVSLNTGLRNMDQCPLVSRLMQESQMLKSRTEDSINSLNNSMEEIKEIRKEQDGIKWDFLRE